MHSSTKLSHNIHGNGYDALNDAVSMADIVLLTSAFSVCSICHMLSSLFHDSDSICFDFTCHGWDKVRQSLWKC